MNTEFFIAKRLSFDKESKKNISNTIVKIATYSIALSIAVMIITISVVTGFKIEIRKKIIGFGSHIQITNYDFNNSYETRPINKNQSFFPEMNIPGIEHIQTFAVKPGIIKTKSDVQGIILKGIDKEFDWSFFQESLIKGKIFTVSDTIKTNDALISKFIADLLKFDIGDEFIVSFPVDKRYRRLKISGIYETGLEEFDKQFMITDIKHIQRLNNWSKDEISGFEILINDFNDLEQLSVMVHEKVGLNFTDMGTSLQVENIKEMHPQIFDWLGLQNRNVQTLLTLTLLIAILNMITGLLILIIERTNMIGILKSFGATNSNVQKIFLYQSVFLIIKGLVWGNLIGITLCLLQYHFNFIKLDQSSYWLSTVPVNLNILNIAFLNIASLAIILSVMIIPSLIISNIQPAKSIKFN